MEKINFSELINDILIEEENITNLYFEKLV
jgi:hypothetical protein